VYSPNDHRLGFRERLGYGLGDTASNFYFQIFNIFLFYYYTNVFAILNVMVLLFYRLSDEKVSGIEAMPLNRKTAAAASRV